MLRATTSLPVPDSPRIRTVASVSATCSIIRRTRRTAALVPTRLRKSSRERVLPLA